ncbi:MAG: hypothetical protein JNJ85_08130 [Candidatus Kapabacteria bacterium]|nr:hypothetical protein [Candidatus Kapabacteria bacterium]MBX7155160.1 hypothetical protein [Bacteroidota bacterium]
MIIISLIIMVTGVLLVLYSSELSGKALSPDDIFNKGGFKRLLRHIFTHRPFDGYKEDIRILLYGATGLLMIYGGSLMMVYFITWVYAASGVNYR